MQSITVGSNTYNLVAMPGTPAPAAIEFEMSDTVSAVVNPFTQQQQTQYWGGGDMWRAKVTLPPMKHPQVAAWKAFLAQLSGVANVLQLGDPDATAPLGSGAGTPVTTGTNNAMATSLTTSGWTASQSGVLEPGDYFQLGYRLYMVVGAAVNSDTNGDATISIWPSLREAPAPGVELTLVNAVGLFRLAKNQRGWQASPRRATTISFDVEEVR